MVGTAKNYCRYGILELSIIEVCRQPETLRLGLFNADPTRLTPRTAGFGAATGAMDMRTVQMQIRFRF